MNATRKWQVELRDIYPQLLASLPLPTDYKTRHLLDPVDDVSPDKSTVVEPVSLNAVTVQTTFMPLADITPWHHDDDDPVPIYLNREWRVHRVEVNTSDFTSDLFPQINHEPYPPVFDNNDIPVYDLPTKVNLLDVGNMNKYRSHDPDIITVNAVKISKDDPTTIRGQFDSGADATVTNLLIYLHNY